MMHYVKLLQQVDIEYKESQVFRWWISYACHSLRLSRHPDPTEPQTVWVILMSPSRCFPLLA